MGPPKTIVKKEKVSKEVTDEKGLGGVAGFQSDYASADLVRNLANFYFQGNQDETKSLDLTFHTLLDLAPQDGLEGMLLAQMLATHKMAMEMLTRAQANNHNEVIDRFVNGATKLLRTFAVQTSALNALRGKGPNIQVENVNVSEGGQAIVGSVTTQSSSK